MKNSRRNRGYTPQEKKTYKVIGWTDYDDDYFPINDGDDGVFDAVVEAVRDCGYMFGGDSHQDMSGCCPVLNDGTRACFSWRGWGGVIAAAYERHGKYDYMGGYMDEMIVPSAICRPSRYVDYSAINDEKSKTFTLRLPPSQGIECFKTYDVRVNDETVKDIEKFDYIDFLDVNIPDDNEFGCVYSEFTRVREVIRAASFEEIFDDPTFDAYMWDIDGSGYDDCKTKEEIIDALYKDYPRELVQKHGVVCFILHFRRDNDHQR